MCYNSADTGLASYRKVHTAGGWGGGWKTLPKTVHCLFAIIIVVAKQTKPKISSASAMIKEDTLRRIVTWLEIFATDIL